MFIPRKRSSSQPWRLTWQKWLTVWAILVAIALPACTGISSTTTPPNTRQLLTEVALTANPPDDQLATAASVHDTGGTPGAATPDAVSTQEPSPVAPEVTPEPAALPTLPAPLKPIAGLEVHSLANPRELEAARDSGAYWVRINALEWSKVEPQEGQRNWQAVAGLEADLKKAGENQLHVVLVVRSTPAWAQKHPGILCGPPAVEKLAAFGRFLQDAVKRYSVPPYSVLYWEIGNEPDVDAFLIPPESVFGCLGQEGDPFYGGQYYADILKTVYAMVKIANSQAQVLVGGLLLNCDPINPPPTEVGGATLRDCTPSLYLEGILTNGGGDFFDGISFHAYDSYQGGLGKYGNFNWHTAWNLNGPALVAKSRYLRSVLAKYNQVGKYLMNTEVALICGRDGSEAVCQTDEYNLTKAYYLVQAYTHAVAERLHANIWYSTFGWRASGLLFADQPEATPAFQAFQVNAVQMKDTVLQSELSQYSGVKGFIFKRGEQKLWVAWSLDGQPHTLQFETLPSQILDVFGNPLPVTGQMDITLMPVYILFSE